MASKVRGLCESSAGQLANLIRRREVSSREVMLAHLERIDLLNGELGAVTRVLRDQALAAADRCDRSEPRGPLHGVPFSVKENLDCMGSATTHGLPALREALPYADAPMVERLKGAGAIPIARTNLSELGLRLCTVNPLRGRTFNPYDRRLSAGGSSGGDAVAVATGMVPLGLGNDLGGSLRVPAHANGVCTLKPTTGRIAHASSLPPYDYGPSTQLMLAPGPLARSVSDLRLALTILAGRDRRDPRSVDAPLSGPEPESRRAALVTELPGAPLPASSVAAIRRAGDALRAAGWEVEEAQPPDITRVNEVFEGLLAADLAVIAQHMQPFISEALFAHLERVCRAAAGVELSSYQLYVERSRLQRAWSGFFCNYPLLIGPTFARQLWQIDADLDAASGVDLLRDSVRFITPGNALGLPALVLPLGLTNGPGRCDAHPMHPTQITQSVQIYADVWREDLCLRAAEVIEAGCPTRQAPDLLSSMIRGTELQAKALPKK